MENRSIQKTWELLDAKNFVSTPEKWVWDTNFDGAKASSDHHKILFENEHVRILEIAIHPGEKEDFHTHERKSIMIIDSAVDMRYYGADRKSKFERKFPKEAILPTTITWREPEGLHSIENIDETRMFHGVRIELK